MPILLVGFTVSSTLLSTPYRHSITLPSPSVQDCCTIDDATRSIEFRYRASGLVNSQGFSLNKNFNIDESKSLTCMIKVTIEINSKRVRVVRSPFI